jgi:hypothetical protein
MDKYLNYIENKMTETEEEKYFSEMSKNTELRAEFKDNLKIDIVLVNNSKFLSPSSAATNALFASAGIGLRSSKIPLYSSVLEPTLFTILGIILASVGFSFFSGEEQSPEIIVKNIEPIIKYDTIQTENTQTIDSLNSMLKNLQSKNSYFKSKANTNSNEGIKTENITKEGYSDKNRNINYSSIESINYGLKSNYNYKNENIYNSVNSIDNTSNLQFDSPNNHLLNKFSLSINKLVPFALQNQVVEPDYPTPLNDMGINLSYNITDNLNLIADFRVENFYQVFETEEADSEFRYYQNPSLASYGLGLSYELFHFSNFDITPQIIYGINQAGFIQRYGIITAYELVPGLKTNLIFEYNSLRFNQLDRAYFSDRFNINFGININL